jgi:FAD/FMN-containing dehydrogenase
MHEALIEDAPTAALARGALDQLRTRVRGPLLLPGDAGYDDARSIWNAMIDRRPGAILRCLGVADVIAGLAFARAEAVPLSIKGGGHNIAGLAVCEGGLMLDMSLMRGVWVDPATRTARAQAGCLLGDVDRETQLHGLAAVLGFVSNTGIAGLTLGGGFGYLTRRFGWTCDNVRAVEVVTADGRVVRASDRDHADLFWGLRGGGGNFGIVTGFDYVLYPIGPEIAGGPVAWRADDSAEVLELYRATTAEAPLELTCVALLRPAPAAPWLPASLHGKPIVAIAACDTGPVADARARISRIKTFGSPVGDVLQPRPYVSQQSLLDATQPKGRRYYWKSEYLPRLEPELLANVIEHAGRIESPHSAIVLFHVQGVLDRLPTDYSAVGNRDAAYVLGIAASWENAAEDAKHIEWARAAWRDLRRFSTGGTYVNFLTADEGDDRIRAAYGANYERLAAVKARWDGDNVLRVNKNIAPVA